MPLSFLSCGEKPMGFSLQDWYHGICEDLGTGKSVIGFFTCCNVRTYQEYPDLTDVSVPDLEDLWGGGFILLC